MEQIQSIKERERMVYSVQWSLGNARQHGSPQARERFYLIAIRFDCLKGSGLVAWPLEQPPVSAATCLNPLHKEDDPSNRPDERTQRHASAVLKLAMNEIAEICSEDPEQGS